MPSCGPSRQESLDLGGRRHGVRAGQPGRDDGPGGVREAHHPLEVPAGQQPVAQGPAERVTGAEAVDDLDRHRRYLDRRRAVVREHALGALLDDREVDAELVQRPRGRYRLPLADRGLALVEVADRDVTCGSACCTQRLASSRDGQNIGR